MDDLRAVELYVPKYHLMELFELKDFDPAQIEGIETYPCATYTDDRGHTYTERCGPDEAQFYSVYFTLKEGDQICVADCADARIASHVARCLCTITGVKVYY